MVKLLTIDQIKTKSEKVIKSFDIRKSKIKGIEHFDHKFDKQWTGEYRYYGYFFADYLNYKYDNVCASKDASLVWNGWSLNINNGFRNPNVTQDSKAKNDLIEFIRNCKKRFIIIPIGIFMHQNIIIYDTKLNEIELFDSYGQGFADEMNKNFTQEVDKNFIKESYNKYIECIKFFFKEIIGDKFKFYKPVDFFPVDTQFQNLEIELCPTTNFKLNSWGFCVVWAFWYAENRIENPNVPRQILVKKFLDLFKVEVKQIKSKKSDNRDDVENRAICKVIRGYSTFLLNLDSNKSFFQKNLLFAKLYKDFLLKQGIILSVLSLYTYICTV